MVMANAIGQKWCFNVNERPNFSHHVLLVIPNHVAVKALSVMNCNVLFICNNDKCVIHIFSRITPSWLKELRKKR